MAEKGTEQPGFDVLLKLAGAKKAYVKLSAPHRISTLEPNYVDVAPIAKQLIAAAPDRMLWGSDWPHTVRTPGKGPFDIHPFRVVDDVHDLDLLRQWAGEGEFKRILVDNPARLYRF
jgi:predicted TIM-barrel fold metal-dependent hydrolase